ncbi:hypothetical protein SAMN06298212_11531 [Ruaniaceae bacterium KH17]|nr:hypothetical protein SAMN06298212_11531 [Ruaniaceae bacterium KH17]
MSIENAVREIEAYTDRFGWDGPLRLFALVRTSALGDAMNDGSEITAVEQDELPQADSLEDLLAQIAWPEAVDGCAIAVERVIVEGDDGAVIGPEEALTDPRRRDVRLAVGVLRDGGSWCAVRLKGFDELVESADAVPDLIEALRLTLQ